MPQLTRLSREQDVQLVRLMAQTGLERRILIDRLVSSGLAVLEAGYFIEDTSLSSNDRPIDQLLRESGLGV